MSRFQEQFPEVETMRLTVTLISSDNPGREVDLPRSPFTLTEIKCYDGRPPTCREIKCSHRKFGFNWERLIAGMIKNNRETIRVGAVVMCEGVVGKSSSYQCLSYLHCNVTLTYMS
jgi:hypothetical protein